MSLAARLLPGSRRARVRVRVNDGFNEAVSTSPRFHSKGAPPSVQILSPAPATRATNDAPLYLSGQAYDDTQRRIPGRRLRWFDGRRAIGRGGQIAVSGLAAGRRRLRLVARDARGRTRTAAVTVRLRAAQPTFLRLSAPRRVSGTARLLRLRVASSIPATLRVGRQRFAVGRRMRSIRLRIRRGRSPLALRLILRAGGKRAVRTVVIARR